MKLWNKIKQTIHNWRVKSARIEVMEFMTETGLFKDDFPENLKKRKERMAYKENLVATYSYQPDDDLLVKKQDFIDKYTHDEQDQVDYFVTKNPFVDEFRTRAWNNHEQVERREAQKAWRQVAKRNYHAQMRQKYTSQNTR